MILRRHSRVVGVLRIINIAKECNNGEREGLEKEKKKKRKRKEEKEYTSDIINDFSVIIGVFTDLESVVDLSTTVFTLAASVNM